MFQDKNNLRKKQRLFLTSPLSNYTDKSGPQMDGSHIKGDMGCGDEMGRSKATKSGFPSTPKSHRTSVFPKV